MTRPALCLSLILTLASCGLPIGVQGPGGDLPVAGLPPSGTEITPENCAQIRQAATTAMLPQMETMLRANGC